MFRYSARYSGRLSLFVYLLCFYLFSLEYKQGVFNFTKKATLVFAILHLIHFVYLSLSVFLNDLPIVPYKLLGGFIAYLLIIIYPFIIDKISNSIFHIIYFYYVGIVMAMTYIARIKGEFIGAPTELFHYVGLSLVLLSFIILNLVKPIISIKYDPAEVSLKLVIFPKHPTLCKSGTEFMLLVFG